MKKSNSPKKQIVKAIKVHEEDLNAEDICRDVSIRSAPWYKWKQRYCVMEVQELKKLKKTEEKNAGLST